MSYSSSKKLNSCNYVNLNSYSSPMVSATNNVILGPGGEQKYYQVVPCVKPIAYDALTHGVQGSSCGYFDVNAAYKSTGGDCNQQYVKRMCD
jgi:hypothetical protein